MNRLDSSIVDSLLLLAPHTEIVHHIPGRILLRILRSGIAIAAKADLQAILRSIPGIRQVRVNPVVGSAVVEYDPQTLPHRLWEKLGQLRRDPSLRPALKQDLEALG